MLSFVLAVALSQCSPEGPIYSCPSTMLVAPAPFRFATASGVGMPTECQDKAVLYTTGGKRVYSQRANASTLLPFEILCDGGTAWDGGPGATVCAATCTKGDQWHVAPGGMVCMSPHAPRVTRGGDGSSPILGVLAEGAYRGNQLGDTQAFETFQAISSGGPAAPTVTANAALSPFGVMNAERVQIPATSGSSQYSMLLSFHGCQNAGAATVASIYVANFDGGTLTQRPDLVFNRTASDYVRAQCESTGAGDGGLLYTRCFTPPSTAGDVNGNFYFGSWPADGGTRAAMDLAVFGGQCEITTYFPTSYIPNGCHNDQVGFAYPGQSRGVDVLSVFLDETDVPTSPVAVSMSSDVIVPSTISETSEVFQALNNGSFDYRIQLQSGYNNNTPDWSMSFNVHPHVVGLTPIELLWNESNHMAGRWSKDSGIVLANLNGNIDAGFFSGSHLNGFVPLGPGHDHVLCPDGGHCAIWNVCGDYSSTHSAFGVCKNVCLSIASETACQ